MNLPADAERELVVVRPEARGHEADEEAGAVGRVAEPVRRRGRLALAAEAAAERGLGERVEGGGEAGDRDLDLEDVEDLDLAGGGGERDAGRAGAPGARAAGGEGEAEEQASHGAPMVASDAAAG